MNPESRNCQNCKNEFVIEPEDFQFYEKIKVPPPTWCPDCRLRRRLLFVNERSLYKRKCDLCGVDSISIFRPGAENPVYCVKCWWSDKWDAMDYGMEVDFSRPFLAQLIELQRKVPEIGRQVMEPTMINSDYCNMASYLKNCYLLFNSDYNEDSAYSTYLERSKRCFDLSNSDSCELCYGGHNLYKDHKVIFSSNSNECVNVSFSKNCIGCTNCFGCVNLRGKSYYIFNSPYTKEEYEKEMAKYDTGSYAACQEIIHQVRTLELSLPKKYMEGLMNVNVSGDYVFTSKNTSNSFEVVGAEDSKFCSFLIIIGTKDSYDYSMWGGGAERMYECMGAGGGQHDVKFTYYSWCNAMNMEYCWGIGVTNSDIFGCVGTKHKKFSILNKEYTESEYVELKAKIIEHMKAVPYIDSMGRKYCYGEFFPPEFSSFGYNETVAQAYLTLSKEEALHQGFYWREPEARTYSIDIPSSQLPDTIREADDSILSKVIGCAHADPTAGGCEDQCSSAFKIIPDELQFYRDMKLPLPRLCSNCRYYERLHERGSGMTLYKRACMCGGNDSSNGMYHNTITHFHNASPCPNQFETSYAPDRPEIVYCKECYEAEVV